MYSICRARLHLYASENMTRSGLEQKKKSPDVLKTTAKHDLESETSSIRTEVVEITEKIKGLKLYYTG